MAALAPALISLLVFLPALRNGFVNWDDHIYVLNNPHIRNFDLDLIRTSFFSFYENFWLPLTWISLAGDYALWGLDPMGYHLLNLILHSVNTFLFAILFTRLVMVHEAVQGRTPWSRTSLLLAVFAAGALFGLHPLRVESVAWVSERKDVLSLFFALPALLLYLSYAQAATERETSFPRMFSRYSYWASFALFCCSLASKPMTVTIPVVMLIIDWFPLGRLGTRGKTFAVFVEKVPFFLASGAVGIITLIAQRPSMMTVEDVTLGARFILAGKSTIDYLLLMIWPQGLIPFYVHPGNHVDFLSSEYFLPLLLIIAISALSVRAARKGDNVWLAVWLFYLLTLLPILGITQTGSQAKADRFTYLPCLGPTVLVSIAIGRLAGKNFVSTCSTTLVRYGTVALLVATTAIYSYLSVSLIGVWRSTETLWSRVIAVRPMGTGRAYFERGKYYGERGDYGAALKDMNVSLLIAQDKNYSRSYRIYAARAEIYRQMGRYDDALADANRAVELNPSPSASSYRLRAAILARLGRQVEAELDLEAAARDDSISSQHPYGGMYEAR